MQEMQRHAGPWQWMLLWDATQVDSRTMPIAQSFFVRPFVVLFFPRPPTTSPLSLSHSLSTWRASDRSAMWSLKNVAPWLATISCMCVRMCVNKDNGNSHRAASDGHTCTSTVFFRPDHRSAPRSCVWRQRAGVSCFSSQLLEVVDHPTDAPRTR
jgi:hypothetical protein